MGEQINAVWDRIENHIAENKILSLLAHENLLNDIDYSKFLEFGFSQDDVTIGFELIQIYKMLKKYIEEQR
jgi:hypothetical protein